MRSLLLSLGCILALGGAPLRAHTVPALELECIVPGDGTMQFLLNVDPRLFMSTTPAKLPPVTAQWYRDLTPEAKDGAEKAAATFVGKSLELLADQMVLQPHWKFVPIDGADNTPLRADTVELHLLADATMPQPPTAKNFKVRLSQQCPAALTLLSTLEGKTAARPQVLFPGEESRTIALPESAPPTVPAIAVPWYSAPWELGWRHVISPAGWPHWVFTTCLLLAGRRPKVVILGLFCFHTIHITATALCGWQLWVLPMPDALWPTACLPLFLAQKPHTLAFSSATLAVLHVLDEWPTAVTPSVGFAAELGLAGGHFVLVLAGLGLMRLYMTQSPNEK